MYSMGRDEEFFRMWEPRNMKVKIDKMCRSCYIKTIIQECTIVSAAPKENMVHTYLYFTKLRSIQGGITNG